MALFQCALKGYVWYGFTLPVAVNLSYHFTTWPWKSKWCATTGGNFTNSVV